MKDCNYSAAMCTNLATAVFSQMSMPWDLSPVSPGNPGDCRKRVGYGTAGHQFDSRWRTFLVQPPLFRSHKPELAE